MGASDIILISEVGLLIVRQHECPLDLGEPIPHSTEKATEPRPQIQGKDATDYNTVSQASVLMY